MRTRRSHVAARRKARAERDARNEERDAASEAAMAKLDAEAAKQRADKADSELRILKTEIEIESLRRDQIEQNVAAARDIDPTARQTVLESADAIHALFARGMKVVVWAPEQGELHSGRHP